MKRTASLLCTCLISLGLLAGCASNHPAVENATEVRSASVGPVKMAGPEENWANFAGAVDRDRADVVTYMISQGISPNTIVNGGDPALVRAIRMDASTVVDALLESKGIEVDMASEYGETALMLAAFKGNMELVQRLLAEGASVNRIGGWTPLHYAAAEGHNDIVKLFLEKGARVNVQTYSGITPLYMAARKPSREVVMTLLRAGSYRDLCNDKGQSPADAADQAGDEQLAKFLAIEKCVQPAPLLRAPIRSSRLNNEKKIRVQSARQSQ